MVARGDMGVEIPEGTMVNQAVYAAIDGELCAVYAMSYAKMRSAAAGLVTLNSYRKVTPVMLCGDFMLTEEFIRNKFDIKTRRIVFPTREERDLLKTVTEHFPQAILLLNIGCIMDLSFLDEYDFGAVLLLWQGGMESGNAAADLLCGKKNPSGRLTDTVAMDYWDYPSSRNFGNREFNNYAEDIFVGYRYFETFCPEKVRYPFGYGLSYTEFSTECVDCRTQKDGVALTVKVKNIGGVSGKESDRSQSPATQAATTRPM